MGEEDDRRRRSPTPPHNTREFQTWVDFAEAATSALADYPPSLVASEIIQKLRDHSKVFAGWAQDSKTRPAPTDRLPEMNAFMETRGKAIDLLMQLAKMYPKIAEEALARHREAARRARSGGGGRGA